MTSVRSIPVTRPWSVPRLLAPRLRARLTVGVLLLVASVIGAATAALAAPGHATRLPHTPSHRSAVAPLPAPTPLAPFFATAIAGEGSWHAAGRTVNGHPAVFETTLRVPGLLGVVAGVAWMDTRLLRAILYSGSESPGGNWQYTAPIAAAQAATLVTAFNGGFKMSASGGGYYSEGRLAYPLRIGAASLVIYRSGLATVGVWGRDVAMTPSVVAVRQNLSLLVDGDRPTPLAATGDWLVWGATCGAYSCSGPGIEDQWRSGVGVTNNGALVYVAGPSISPLALAELLARGGAVRAMELDINPFWPTFATYAPNPPNAPANPANGTDLLAGMSGGPARFFTPSWARDFVTMSAR